MSDDFEQQLLLPPSAIEIRIRLGVVPERDHAQVMVEALEPATRVLLAQWSRPHFALVNTDDALQEAVQRAAQYFQTYVSPF